MLVGCRYRPVVGVAHGGCVGDDIVLVERRLTDVLCVQHHASLNANYSFTHTHTHTHTHTDRLSAAAVLPRDAMLARYIQDEVTWHSPWSRYVRHFVGIIVKKLNSLKHLVRTTMAGSHN